MEFKTLDRYTRAGREGKEIKCPNCGVYGWVYHFSWCALTCQGCGKMIDKNEWFIKVK
tara:strand:- start:783 stop:956 length:174 start_codon:yes stop_codon:yes gene_type:complete